MDVGQHGEEAIATLQTPQPLSPAAGAVFAPFVTAQLDQERARKTSIESRALNVITSSGALIALTTGILTIARNGSKETLSPIAVAVIVVAYALFLLAACVGLVTNYLGNSVGSYAEIPLSNLQIWVKDWASTDQLGASQSVAEQQLATLAHARELNTNKTKFLALAVAAEVVAVTLLVTALGIVLIHA